MQDIEILFLQDYSIVSRKTYFDKKNLTLDGSIKVK